MRFVMTRRVKAISVLYLAVALIWSGLSVAVDDPPYMLSHVGSLLVGGDNANEQQMIGAVVGLRLNNSFYLEGEVNASIAGGSYASEAERGKMRISTFGLYGAYRFMLSPDYYFKARAGLVYEDINRLNENTQGEKDSNGSSASGGIGLGIVYHINKKPVMIELEATTIEQNIMLYTVGMTAPF